jgi:zinc protease
VALPTLPTPAAPDKTRIYLVDQPKAAQSEIRIGYISLPYDATGEYYKAGLMNFVLGGAFNSRINLNLREDKGYTYGARSGFSGNDFAGPFTASAGVKATATDSSVVEFMKEIVNYRNNGITEAELAFMKNSIGQSEARKYETGIQKAFFLRRILDYSLPKGFVAEQDKILQGLSKADVDALAKKYLRPENAYIVIVGDKALVKPGLEKLGYEVVELDKTGNVVK